MKIHLIRSKDVSNDLYEGLESLLVEKGPMTFHFDDNYAVDFGDAEVLAWDRLFEACADYRIRKKISKDELIFILTNIPNDEDWFSAIDVRNATDGFVHTGDWEQYFTSEPVHPVAYQIVALILHKFIAYSEPDQMMNRVHHKPIGCVSDFCDEKDEVILQTRAADICNDCLSLLEQRASSDVIIQSFRSMESIRGQRLFARRLSGKVPQCRLVVHANGDIQVEGYGNAQLKFRPMDAALYLFLLYHGKPVALSELYDYWDELFAIYNIISDWESPIDDDAIRSGILERNTTIDNLTNSLDNTNNRASEAVSRIRKDILQQLGEAHAKEITISDFKVEQKNVPSSKKEPVKKYIPLAAEFIIMDRPYWEQLISKTLKRTQEYRYRE